MSLGRLYSVPEAAELLRVTPAALRRWISLRRLTVVKLGARVVLEEAELQRVIEAGRRPAWPARRPGRLGAGGRSA